MSHSIDTTTLWLTIIGLGGLTFLTRFLFLGLIRHGALPGYVVRLLHYVPVTVLPALIAPMVVYPRSLDGVIDPLWLVAAFVALVVGMVTRSMLATIVAGMGVLWSLQWLFNGL
jgi:branched-subunit amino acid transport protein